MISAMEITSFLRWLRQNKNAAVLDVRKNVDCLECESSIWLNHSIEGNDLREIISQWEEFKQTNQSIQSYPSNKKE